MILKAYECPQCYAWIPYLGCTHNCPDPEAEVDEGFYEVNNFLLSWLDTLRLMKQSHPHLIQFIRTDD